MHEFRSLIGKLNWVAADQTRPDLLFDLCDLSSLSRSATVKELFRINKIVTKVKAEKTILSFKKLDQIEKMKIIAYNDSSFGNLKNGGSQGGFIIYLADDNENSVPIMWKSHKLRRVVKSAMAAETIIQVDSAESSYWLKIINFDMFVDQLVQKDVFPLVDYGNTQGQSILKI